MCFVTQGTSVQDIFLSVQSSLHPELKVIFKKFKSKHTHSPDEDLNGVHHIHGELNPGSFLFHPHLNHPAPGSPAFTHNSCSDVLIRSTRNALLGFWQDSVHIHPSGLTTRRPSPNHSIYLGTLSIWGAWFGVNSCTLLHCPFSTSIYLLLVNFC